MSVKDTVTKDFMADSRVFADVFNQLIYEGNQVIQPEKLHPLDSVVASVPYGADGAEIPTQRLRDGLKYLTAMEDDSAVYLLLGVENQTEVHYAMPVRDMLYDALQ
ncbi:MAG: transposase, partial [Lachnospiraceae bacterium]|nr:transposase [Lachnospiraceae bacterium]